MTTMIAVTLEVVNEAWDRQCDIAVLFSRSGISCAVVPPRENAKRTSHCLEGSSCACVNFQFLTALIARCAKYVLEPGSASTSWTTVPELSTLTRKITATSS